MSRLRTTAWWVALWLTTGVLHAHDLGVAKVSLTGLEGERYRVESTVPLSETPETPRFPDRFQVGPMKRTPGIGRGSVVAWDAGGGGALRTTDEIVLPWARDGAFVTASWRDGTRTTRFFPLDNSRTVVRIGRLGGETPGLAEVAPRYGLLGIKHILLGWDHLAFVLAIFLLTSGRKLVRLITGFTLGHSVTLVAAVLGWVNVPSPPVEAAIALSIVLVAWQAMSKSPSLQHGFWVVFGFGLLHGIGFAGVLADVGVPRGELISGLLFFNLGVEAGQLLFVAAIAALAMPVPNATRFRPALATCLVLLGAFWTISRVAAFAG